VRTHAGERDREGCCAGIERHRSQQADGGSRGVVEPDLSRSVRVGERSGEGYALAGSERDAGGVNSNGRVPHAR